MITVGSLTSGIGGIEYGLEKTGGFRTIWFVENDRYASAVLRKHWPRIPNFGDITKTKWESVERPDMLAGGFPCQDISVAGKGKGIAEGTRSGLWKEYAKAIRILRPKYALIENVPELANRGLDIVLADIASMGYDAEWNIISASGIGAPHRRERLFVIAHAKHNGCNGSACETKGCDGCACPSPNRISLATNFNSQRIQGSWAEAVSRIEGFSWCKDIRSVEDLFSRSNIPKPLICRGDDGFSNRMDRIKCLGNAVVPQVAEAIGKMILEHEKRRE